jgi:8-oxo-dGTP diphosphatase
VRIDVVCGVIRNDAGCLLACRRPAGKHLGGLWEFPGGKVEAGEMPEIALLRELREELGVEVIVERGMTEVPWDYPAVAIRLLPFVCRISQGGPPRAIEHAELRWLTLDDLKTLAWAPADEPVIRELQNLAAGFRTPC